LAEQLPFLPWVAWDVVITDDGFLINEGNEQPSLKLLQTTGRCSPTRVWPGFYDTTAWCEPQRRQWHLCVSFWKSLLPEAPVFSGPRTPPLADGIPRRL
jgi:hypothetical protein